MAPALHPYPSLGSVMATLGSQVVISGTVATDVLSVSLAAGKWFVYGRALLQGNSAGGSQGVQIYLADTTNAVYFASDVWFPGGPFGTIDGEKRLASNVTAVTTTWTTVLSQAMPSDPVGTGAPYVYNPSAFVEVESVLGTSDVELRLRDVTNNITLDSKEISTAAGSSTVTSATLGARGYTSTVAWTLALQVYTTLAANQPIVLAALPTTGEGNATGITWNCVSFGENVWQHENSCGAVYVVPSGGCTMKLQALAFSTPQGTSALVQPGNLNNTQNNTTQLVAIRIG